MKLHLAGGSSPPQVETFSVSKTLTLSKNTRWCVEYECCCPRTVNISNVSFTSKISIPPEPVLKNMGQQMSGPDSSINRLEHSALIRRLGVRVPLRSRHFLSQKLWHFHKNTRSCVENECCCPRTVNISNVNFTLFLLLNFHTINLLNLELGLLTGDHFVWASTYCFLFPFFINFH